MRKKRVARKVLNSYTFIRMNDKALIIIPTYDERENVAAMAEAALE